MTVRSVFLQKRGLRAAAVALVACLLSPAAGSAQDAVAKAADTAVKVEGPAADRMVAEWMVRCADCPCFACLP